MFPIKFIDNADRIYRETESKLGELISMELHECAGTDIDKLQFKLRRIMAGNYLKRGLEEPIHTRFFSYIPKSSRKIIAFANKYHDLYSYFQKERGY